MIVIEYELMDVPEADGEREIRIKETNKLFTKNIRD
jgi:hypothetical protein